MPERDEWIARKAYDLWEQAERPQGRDRDHWQEASQRWEAGNQHLAVSKNDRPDWDEESEE